MSNINGKIRGTVTVQVHNVGISSDDKIKSISGKLAPSAANLKKLLEAQGIRTSNPEEDVKKDGSESQKTTESYSFVIDPMEALVLLDKYDKKDPNTPDYERKMENYQSKLESFGGSINELSGDRKVEALKALQPFSFSGYTVQLSLIVDNIEEPEKTMITHSKKHRRLEKVSQEQILKMFQADSLEWVQEQSEETPDDDHTGEGVVSDQL